MALSSLAEMEEYAWKHTVFGTNSFYTSIFPPKDAGPEKREPLFQDAL